MKKIMNHTGNKMILSSETVINKDEFEIINIDIGHYDHPLQSGIFGGSPEADVNLSQGRDLIG